jgi:hypothetical protein
MARWTRQMEVPFCLRFKKTDKFLKFDLYIDDILNEIKAPARHPVTGKRTGELIRDVYWIPN